MVLVPVLECARARGGYLWWYVEAHDTVEQRYGLTLILFAGSVFSPHYAARLRRGELASGLEHPAVNLAFYERSQKAKLPARQRLWVMNEYAPAALRLDSQRLEVQHSHIEKTPAGALHIELHEETTRFFGRPGPRLDASVRISPPQNVKLPELLELGRNAAGEVHFWQPLIVASPVEVELSCGPLHVRYRGVAYSDRNFGSGRLEDTFRRWSWAHGVAEKDGQPKRALVLYQTESREGEVSGLSLQQGYEPGSKQEAATLLRCDGKTENGTTAGARDFLWLAVPQSFSVGPGKSERQRGGRLEDAPFYARYLAELSDPAGRYLGVGEYLDLDRFRLRSVQGLLTYKSRQVPA